MDKRKPVTVKLLLHAVIVAVTGSLLLLAGIGVGWSLLSVTCLGFLLWWFTRNPPPKEESPMTGVVSCCHYLQDDEDGK